MVSIDPQMEVRTFRQHILEMIESTDDLDMASVGLWDDFLTALQTFDALHITNNLPENFSVRAWPSYVECLQDHRYWLAPEELVLLGALSHRSVAVFECIG